MNATPRQTSRERSVEHIANATTLAVTGSMDSFVEVLNVESASVEDVFAKRSSKVPHRIKFSVDKIFGTNSKVGSFVRRIFLNAEIFSKLVFI